MNCLLKPIIEGNIEGGIEVTGRQGRKCKQLLDDFKEMRRYWKLKEKAPDRTLWRTRFGKGCGPVVRQTTKYIFFCLCDQLKKYKIGGSYVGKGNAYRILLGNPIRIGTISKRWA
jgi:hypothetical protein